MAVLAHLQAAHVIARQSRLELTQLIGVEFVGLDAVFPAQIPGSLVLVEALERPIHIKIAEAMDETLGAGVPGQRLERFERRPDKGTQSARRRPRLHGRARPDEANEP